MKLQRKWAWIAMAFFIAAVLLAIAACVMAELITDSRCTKEIWIQTSLSIGALVSSTVAVIVMRKHLCCPHCKALSVNPWQKRGTIHYCSQCGAALVFDDGKTK